MRVTDELIELEQDSEISIARHVHSFESLMKTYCFKSVMNTDNVVVDHRTFIEFEVGLELAILLPCGFCRKTSTLDWMITKLATSPLGGDCL